MRLLIIGSLEGHIGAASRIALNRGSVVTQADTIETALKTLRSGRSADLIMMDVGLGVKDLMEAFQRERFHIPVVACGIGTNTELAVQAIKSGAKEYLPLPPDADLIAAVFEAVAQEDDTLIFRDPVMKNTLALAGQIAPSDASVLITGESGTGKEVIARFIHRKSRRCRKPFITVNCAAIPENLLESELFGHEKGSFTGAVARRIGKFEEANGGTLLLDEISEMHPRLQAKLLRAIQEREIDRVGGTRPVPVDIRILATSNRNLEEEVKQGNFREDLYFRLNVVTVLLPPLRERPLDIQPLSEYFLKKYSQSNGLPLRILSKDAQDILLRHRWRGNVRELENTMHRAVLLASGDEIDSEAIQVSGVKTVASPISDKHSASDGSGTNLFEKEESDHVNTLLVGRTVADVEKDLILGTLSHCLGNRTQAAHILGISIRTLRNKLHQYNQENPGTASEIAAYQATG